MNRRPLLAVALGGLAAAGLPRPGRAQGAWPERPIRMVVPWPPGQATDLLGRIVAQKISEGLGQPVVAENRAGGGGQIGTDAVAKAAPDGYTILAASSGPVSINPLVQKVNYDPERDLAPVSMVGISAYVLVVRPDFPANDIRSFIAEVKSKPGKYSFASSGAGATAHLVAEAFNRRAGLDTLHVPFPGSAPALTAIAGKQVDYAVETLAGTQPLVRQGALRGFGISLAKGSTLAPEFPPLASVGGDLAGFDIGAWLGIMVPARTPKPIIERLDAEIRRSMNTEDARAKLGAAGLEPDIRGTAEFAALLKEQREVFGAIVKAANLRPD